MTSPVKSTHTRVPVMLIIFSLLALAGSLAIRLTAPSDLWEYTQHKTVSYTTDILVHGGSRWILPLDKGAFPATKPPLYNWVAVPFVKWLGFSSETAHKFPSVIALCACWVVMVRLGNRLHVGLGWMIGLALVANHTMMKLGYIARPDMLLTLWLTGAWLSATACFAKSKSQFPLSLAFWLFVTLAALTKGPAALVAIAFAVIGARVLRGSWGAIRVLHPVTGILIVFLMSGTWLWMVYKIDPNHVTITLWKDEFLSRIQGTNPEIVGDAGGGFLGWLRSLPYHPLYFLGRFFPWSIAALLSLVDLWGKSSTQNVARPPLAFYLRSAAVFVIIVISVYTISTGKRADYIAAAFPPASLLAAWWIVQNLTIARWLVPSIAALVLTIHGWRYHFAMDEPTPGYSEAMSSFVREASTEMNAQPLPLVVCPIGNSYVPALLGHSAPHRAQSMLDAVRSGEPFWLLTSTAPDTDCSLLLQGDDKVHLERRLTTTLTDPAFGVSLYYVAPERGPASDPS